jgi:hypothetical protein
MPVRTSVLSKSPKSPAITRVTRFLFLPFQNLTGIGPYIGMGFSASGIYEGRVGVKRHGLLHRTCPLLTQSGHSFTVFCSRSRCALLRPRSALKCTERPLLGFCHGYCHLFDARSDADMNMIGAGLASIDPHSDTCLSALEMKLTKPPSSGLVRCVLNWLCLIRSACRRLSGTNGSYG